LSWGAVPSVGGLVERSPEQLGQLGDVSGDRACLRYYSYGSDDICVVVTATGLCTGAGYNMQKSVQTIRSELVWRFNFGGPVMARY